MWEWMNARREGRRKGRAAERLSPCPVGSTSFVAIRSPSFLSSTQPFLQSMMPHVHRMMQSSVRGTWTPTTQRTIRNIRPQSTQRLTDSYFHGAHELLHLVTPRIRFQSDLRPRRALRLLHNLRHVSCMLRDFLPDPRPYSLSAMTQAVSCPPPRCPPHETAGFPPKRGLEVQNLPDHSSLVHTAQISSKPQPTLDLSWSPHRKSSVINPTFVHFVPGVRVRPRNDGRACEGEGVSVLQPGGNNLHSPEVERGNYAVEHAGPRWEPGFPTSHKPGHRPSPTFQNTSMKLSGHDEGSQTATSPCGGQLTSWML